MRKIYCRDKRGNTVLVSEEDYLCFCWDKWYENTQGYICKKETRNKKQINVHLHLEVLKRMGFENIVCGDHKDRNKLNCQRENLRPATKSQNGANSKIRKDNTSGYRGVSYQKSIKRWKVEIQIQGKSQYLGLFNTPEEGALVYNEAALKYFGEFATLNKVKNCLENLGFGEKEKDHD